MIHTRSTDCLVLYWAVCTHNNNEYLTYSLMLLQPHSLGCECLLMSAAFTDINQPGSLLDVSG